MLGSARILRKVLDTEWGLTWKRKCCKPSVWIPVLDHRKWPDVYMYTDHTSGFSSELSYCLEKKFCITLVARKSRSLNCSNNFISGEAFTKTRNHLKMFSTSFYRNRIVCHIFVIPAENLRLQCQIKYCYYKRLTQIV